MAWSRVIWSLRPGWSRARSFALVATIARVSVLAFVCHVSGLAHFLSDVLLDDDMTCLDEQAHHPQHGTVPRCPTAQGVGQGHNFVPPLTGAVSLPPPEEATPARAFADEASPPFVAPGSIERPPRS